MRSQLPEWWPALPAIAVAALALAACGSPPPTTQLNRAQTAILGAQQDGAQQLASTQLQSAQDKLSSAQASVAQKKMERAKDLAEESEMTAHLADQLALAQKAENMQKAINQ